MADVDITVGADTSAVSAGLAEVKNAVTKVRGEIAAEFAKPLQFLGVAGLVAGMEKVIEKGEEIHHLSEKFGVDAQQLQTLSNAGKESGVSMETMARAMNKLIISQQGAIEGGKGQTAAFNALGISIEEIKGMTPDEIMLRLAAGVSQAHDKTAAYAAVATLLGARMGTDLIPMLEKGSAAIKAQGEEWRKLSNEEVESLHLVKVAQDRYLNDFETWTGKIVAGLGVIGEQAKIMWDNLGTDNPEIKQKRWEDFNARMVGDKPLPKLSKDMTADDWAAYRAQNQKTPAPNEPPPLPGASGAGAGGGAAAAGGGASSSGSASSDTASLYDRIGKINEQNALAQMSAEEKIKQLEFDKTQIRGKYARMQEDGTATSAAELQMENDLADKSKEINAVKKEQADAQEKYNEQLQQTRQRAEDEADEADRRNQTQLLILQYGQEIGSAMGQQLDLQQQIKDVTEEINEAWSEGDQVTAEALTHLRDELDTEEKINAKLIEQAKNREAAKASFEQGAGTMAAMKAGAAGLTTANITDPRVQALFDKGFVPSEWAFTMATNPKTGQVSMDELIKQIVYFNQQTHFGQRNLSTFDQNRALHIQQLQLASDSATERARASSYAASQNALLQQSTYALSSGGLQALFNIPEFSQMLLQLQQINAKLTPDVGQH